VNRRRNASVEGQVVSAFGRMSTADLCDLWEVAWQERIDPEDLEQLLCVATIRRLLLDELETRDPAAFRDWLLFGEPSDAHGHVGGQLNA